MPLDLGLRVRPPAISGRRLGVALGVVASVIVHSSHAFGQAAPEALAAQVTKLDGGASEVRDSGAGAWRQVRLNEPLYVGQSVRTRPLTRATLLLAMDQRQFLLAPETIITLTKALTSTRGGSTTIEILSGKAYSSYSPPAGKGGNLQVASRAAIASITGTEWEIVVDASGRMTVTVLSGEVDFGNELGHVKVGANEEAVAEIGRGPVSRRLTNPRDRVQWVNAYAPDPRRYLSAGSGAVQDAALAITRGDYDTAASTLGDLVKARSAAGPVPYLLLADLMLATGDLPRAREWIAAGQLLFASDDRFDAARSAIELAADRRAESREAAMAALAKNARSLEGLLALGDLDRREGQAAEARAAYQQGATVKPDDARPWYGLGAVFSEREDFRPGREDLRKAIQLDPKAPGYRGELGTLETLANRLDQAAVEYQAALADHPDDYVALTGRGLLALKRGRDAEAIEHLTRATLIEPRYARAAMYLAVAYYRQGRIDTALKALSRASTLDPKDPLPYMLRSSIDTDIFEPGQALDASRTAEKLMPNLKSLNQLANTQKGTANVGNAMAFFGLEEWATHLGQNSFSPFWAGSHLFLSDRYASSYDKESEYTQGLLADPTVFGGSPRFQTLLPKPATYLTSSMLLGHDQHHVRSAPSLGVNGYLNTPRPVGYAANVDYVSREQGASAIDSTLKDRQTIRSAVLGLGVSVTPEVGVFATGTYTDGTQHDTYDPALYHHPDLQWSLFITHLDGGLNYRPSPTSSLSVKLGVGSQRANLPYPPEAPWMFLGTTQWDVQVRHMVLARDHHLFTSGIEIAHASHGADFEVCSNAASDTGYFCVKNHPANIQSLYTADSHEASATAFLSDRFTFGRAGVLEAGVFVEGNQADLMTTYGDVSPPGPVGTGTRSERAVTIRPRIGVALPLGGAVLRLAYQDWTKPRGGEDTLSPVATAGLPIDDTLALDGGRLQRIRGQIDWEVSPRTFATFWADRQEATNGLNLEFENIPTGDAKALQGRLRDLVRDVSRLNVAAQNLREGRPDIRAGHATNTGASVNQLLTTRLSSFLHYEFTDSVQHAEPSDNKINKYAGTPIPFFPTHLLTAGATFITPSRFYVSAELVGRTERVENRDLKVHGIQTATRVVRPRDLTARVGGAWETRSKHWGIEVSAIDLFATTGTPAYSVTFRVRQ